MRIKTLAVTLSLALLLLATAQTSRAQEDDEVRAVFFHANNRPPLMFSTKSAERLRRGTFVSYTLTGKQEKTIKGDAGRNNPDANVLTFAGQLKDENAQVRALAAERLLSLGMATFAAMPALVEALRDSDSKVRYHSVAALGLLWCLRPT